MSPSTLSPDGSGDGGPEISEAQIRTALDRIAALPLPSGQRTRRAILDTLDELAEQLVGRYHSEDTELKQRIRKLTSDLRGPNQPVIPAG